MKLSYEGIGQWAATFACTKLAEGAFVKISGNGTVADCGAGEDFCGVVLYGDPFTTRVLIGGLIVFGAVLLSVLNWKEIFRRKQA